MKYRAIIKSASYRVWGTLVTIILALLFTGNISAALTFGLVETIIKTATYYLHERLWEHVK